MHTLSTGRAPQRGGEKPGPSGARCQLCQLEPSCGHERAARTAGPLICKQKRALPRWYKYMGGHVTAIEKRRTSDTRKTARAHPHVCGRCKLAAPVGITAIGDTAMLKVPLADFDPSLRPLNR